MVVMTIRLLVSSTLISVTAVLVSIILWAHRVMAYVMITTITIIRYWGVRPPFLHVFRCVHGHRVIYQWAAATLFYIKNGGHPEQDAKLLNLLKRSNSTESVNGTA